MTFEGGQEFWVGADPGGKNCFGLAILSADGECLFRTSVSSALQAIGQLVRFARIIQQRDRCVFKLRGVGIDAPLWWSSRPAGERSVDTWIRREYELPSGTVQTPNSLRGAALVQGQMFASDVRQRWPEAVISESHPKAILGALAKSNSSSSLSAHQKFIATDPACQRIGEIARSGVPRSEHERDAIIAAICVREGVTGAWSDLTLGLLHRREQDPKSYWLGPVHYYWPVPVGAPSSFETLRPIRPLNRCNAISQTRSW